MSLNPLAPVTDYQSMLNRIFWFTTASALVATWLLRLYVRDIDVLLQQIDFNVALADNKLLPMPGGFLIPALAVGIAARVFHLHGRVSDWLGIRECFDVDVVIHELARRLSIDLESVDRETLVRHRHRIMRVAFYPFVSTSEPKIDSQLVRQALDAWSWLWIGIEATCVFSAAGFALLAAGVYDIGLRTLCGTLAVAAFGLPALRAQCERYAVAQVRAILADPARATIIERAMRDLIDQRATARAA